MMEYEKKQNVENGKLLDIYDRPRWQAPSRTVESAARHGRSGCVRPRVVGKTGGSPTGGVEGLYVHRARCLAERLGGDVRSGRGE